MFVIEIDHMLCNSVLVDVTSHIGRFHSRAC